MTASSRVWALSIATAATLACGSKSLTTPSDSGGDPTPTGSALSVPVRGDDTTYVSLAGPRVVSGAGVASSLDWDLAFRGYEVFTNGGVSGPGGGAAFGVLSAPTWLSDTAPAVPFLTTDQAGGVFRRWYAYDGTTHVILNRFHVYGVRDGESSLFKVQLLGYYGGVGETVSGVYRLRYAALSASADGVTRELEDLDATAGGDAGNPDEPSTCVDLATGEVGPQLPDQAISSRNWHLCFRRDVISVNGGAAGPRGVSAVDLDASSSDDESLEDLRARSADSELARFEAVSAATLADPALVYRSDGVVSAFTDRWLAAGETQAPAPGVWLVLGADGDAHYLLTFDRFRDATSAGPGTIKLRVKSVR